MKVDIKSLQAKLQPFIQKLRRELVLIFILLLAVTFGFLIFRINQLADSEPSEAAVSEKLKGVKRPKIDQSAIDKIQALETTNVETRSLFKQARDNPFQE